MKLTMTDKIAAISVEQKLMTSLKHARGKQQDVEKWVVKIKLLSKLTKSINRQWL